MGVAIPAGGYAWSSDARLMHNGTGGEIVPTGTAAADLIGDGLTDWVDAFAAELQAQIDAALADGDGQTLAIAHLVAAIYPHAETSDGRLSITAGSGEVTVDAGQSWIWRGGRRLAADDLDTATLPTAASKTYHLRWHAPGTGTATPAGDYPAGRLELADMDGLTETDAGYDSTLDRMLVARVVTDGGNAATILPLANAATLAADVIAGGVVTTSNSANFAQRDVAFALDWARGPRTWQVSPSKIDILNDDGFDASDAHDHDYEVTTISEDRYGVDTRIMRDHAHTIIMRGSFHG